MIRPSLLVSSLAALGFALATHALARRTRPDHRYASVFTRLYNAPTGPALRMPVFPSIESSMTPTAHTPVAQQTFVPRAKFSRIDDHMSQDEVDAIIQHYDVIVIVDSDLMSPRYRAGQQILGFRLYADTDPTALPADRWSGATGTLVVETSDGELWVGLVETNTLAQNQTLQLSKPDPGYVPITLYEDEIINVWQCETVVGGPA